MKKTNRSLRLFKYLYSVYHEIDGELKGQELLEYGFFRRENAKQAKEYARTLWNQWPEHRRWLLVSNENGTEVVNHSGK